MIRLATIAACLLAAACLAACSSDDAATSQAQPGVGAPAPTAGTTTDPGTRYLDPGAPLGAVTVETPPTTGTYTAEGWPQGSTSIARPVDPRPVSPQPASTNLGSPDLPPPVTRVPPRPPPPPLDR